MKISVICLLLSLAVMRAAYSADEPSSVRPLALATDLAGKIEGDSDVRADTLLRVSLAASAFGDYDAAESAIAGLDDSRRVLAVAGMVKALAAQGAENEKLLKELESVNRFVSRGNSLAADLARMELGLALAVCKSPQEKVDVLVKEILDKETASAARLRLMILNADQGGSYDHSTALEIVATTAQGGPFPGALTAASELLELAMKRHENAETHEARNDAVKLALQALELPKKANVDTSALQFSAAIKLYRAGAEQKAIPLFEEAMKALDGMPDGYELKSRLHAKWAELWVARGKKDDAYKIIEKGRKLATDRLEPMQQPAVFAELSAAARLAGNETLSEALIEQALQVAETNPNPRVRLLAGVDVCLAFAASGAALSESMKARLLSLSAPQPAPGGS